MPLNKSVVHTAKVAYTIVAFPFLLLIGLALLLGCAFIMVQAMPGILRARNRWMQTLRSQRRLSSSRDQRRLVTEGTLILDSTDLNGWTLDCWWTPDDVAAEYGLAIPTEEDRKLAPKRENESFSHPFDGWCYDRYISLETGKAVLLSTWWSERLAKRLLSRNGSLRSVRSFSVYALLDRVEA